MNNVLIMIRPILVWFLFVWTSKTLEIFVHLTSKQCFLNFDPWLTTNLRIFMHINYSFVYSFLIHLSSFEGARYKVAKNLSWNNSDLFVDSNEHFLSAGEYFGDNVMDAELSFLQILSLGREEKKTCFCYIPAALKISNVICFIVLLCFDLLHIY